MGERIVWIALCAFVGLALSFAGLSSARTGQNANSGTTGGQSNAKRGAGRANMSGDTNRNANSNAGGDANDSNR